MFNTRGPLGVALLTALLGGPAQAQETSSAWTEVRTPHFRVLGHEAPERVEQIAVVAERTLAALSRVATTAGSQPLEPMTLFAFGTNEAYEKLGISSSTPGFLVPHPHGVYAGLRQRRRADAADSSAGRAASDLVSLPDPTRVVPPRIGEVYSNVEVDGGDLVVGLPIDTHLMYLKSPANKLSIAALLDRDANWVGGIPSSNVRSWALMHYLMLGEPEMQRRIPVYLEAIERLERPRRAFTEAFGMRPAEMGRHVDAYLQSDSLPFARLAVGELPEVETRAAHSPKRRRSSPSPTWCCTRRRAPARPPSPACATSRAQAAGSTRYWTARGEAERRHGHEEAADSALRRAVEEDPFNFKAHLPAR